MSARTKWPLHVLLAEDTETDVQLFKMAIARCGQIRSLHVVEDGEEFMEYMHGDRFSQDHDHPVPDIIFLDLKMPKQAGFDVLHWLREHQEYWLIPTNVFFRKPTTFMEMVGLLKLTLQFWSRCERPKRRSDLTARAHSHY